MSGRDKVTVDGLDGFWHLDSAEEFVTHAPRDVIKRLVGAACGLDHVVLWDPEATDTDGILLTCDNIPELLGTFEEDIVALGHGAEDIEISVDPLEDPAESPSL